MVQITSLISIALTSIGIASATRLHVNRGCIYEGIQEKALCQGRTLDFLPTPSNGRVVIYACVERGNPQRAYCKLDATIPPNWADAYFGQDNCLYSAGVPAIRLGCANPIIGGAVVKAY